MAPLEVVNMPGGFNLVSIETRTSVSHPPATIKVTYRSGGDGPVKLRRHWPLVLGFRPTWLKGNSRRPFPWQIVAALIVGAGIGFIVFQVIGVM